MDGGSGLLKDYRAKRDFSRTPEPEHGSTGSGSSFCVQKHDATRLHYDFRLELDGVLKSWAVTKGPSYDPHEKRLAVRTEDHPLSYGGFEGVIPKGNYGGGTVMLWDRGSWTPDGDPHEGLKKGKLTFTLEGERLNGKWSLVRMRPRGREKRENWLLVKNDDETADPSYDVLEDHAVSVDTGRTLDQIAQTGRAVSEADFEDKPAPKGAGPKPRSRPKAAKAHGLPDWRQPQLATLESSPPDGENWLVEMKYDGYRVLIAKDGGEVRLYTRNGHDWTDRWPNLAEAARELDCRACLLDGEAVAFDANGKPDFSTLQQTMTAGDPVSCFVFDCLMLDGEDLSDRPLTERKDRLAEIVGKRTKPLLYSDHVEGHADQVLARLCQENHEGIIMKRTDRPYRGGRSRDWLKVKCTRRQEFVIGGWQPSDKRTRAFSSILLGAHRDGKLIYAGKVGTGFDAARMEDLAARFEKLARKTSPFAALPKDVKGARFVTPSLVAEVDFAEFTSEGVIRHGAFKGLREDKLASEIVFETAPEPAPEPAMSASVPHETRDRIAGVKLSSPDKVLFKSQGVTKADLAAHYERVADRMLPHVENRLLSLVRCPEGRSAACFFQKHPHKTLPDRFRTLEIEESDGKKEPYVWIDGLPGLIAGVQMGVLEWHIWGSRTDRIERPDRLVFDLDPDEGLAFSDVRDAAFDIRDRLSDLGLATVPMVTGGKGVHVIAPLARRLDWPEIKAFAQNFAKAAARDDPRYVAVMTKSKRKGRIFLDYLRNQRGATAIAPFSTRAREGCPVAMPVTWDELRTLDRANGFSLAEAAERVEAPDPWADAPTNQSLTKRAREAVEP